MANINKDFMVIADLKTARVQAPSMVGYNTDKRIFNIFLKLQITMSSNPDIKVYVTNEEASDYKVKFTVVKPRTNQIRCFEGVHMNVGTSGHGAVYQFDLPAEFTDQCGIYKCELTVTCDVNGYEELITCDMFTYTIKPSVVTGLNPEIESDPELPVLKQLIEEVRELQGEGGGANHNHNNKIILDKITNDKTDTWDNKQEKTDNRLNTNSKEVVGSINELNTSKANKNEVLSTSSVVDNLTSTDTTKVLSANQGKVLDEQYRQIVTDTNNKFSEVNSELETNTKLNSFPKYGNITLPSDFFNNIDFDIYRDFDGKMKHNFKYIDNSEITYYVSESGATTNDGLTTTTVTTLPKAIEYAEASSYSNIKIILLGNYISKDKLYLGANTLINLSKNYYFVADETYCTIGNIARNLSWTLHSAGVYKCNRTLVNNVVDLKHTTVNNMPLNLSKVETLAECEQKNNSYYTDGTILYVHRYDNSQVENNEIYVSMNSVYPFGFSLTKDVKVVFENINFINTFGTGVDNLYIEAPRVTTQGFAILKNCNFIGGGGRNGFASYNLKYTWLFNCYARDTYNDELNYHNLVDGNSFVFEFDCGGFNCGVSNSATENNNATTGHEGIRLLRVNTKGWNTRGPVMADVNGCYSISYDCTMHDSIRTSHVLEKTAFQFGGASSSINPNPPKKAIMYNCAGGGLDTATLTTTGSFGTVYINNLKGGKVYKTVVTEFID